MGSQRDTRVPLAGEKGSFKMIFSEILDKETLECVASIEIDEAHRGQAENC